MEPARRLPLLASAIVWSAVMCSRIPGTPTAARSFSELLLLGSADATAGTVAIAKTAATAASALCIPLLLLRRVAANLTEALSAWGSFDEGRGRRHALRRIVARR